MLSDMLSVVCVCVRSTVVTYMIVGGWKIKRDVYPVETFMNKQGRDT